jgi:putative transposase
MPQSLSSVLVHLVFSTKHRHPWLTDDVRGELHAYMTGILGNLESPSLQTGGVEDHVHVLFALARTKTIAEIVETLKTSSSKWLKSKGQTWSEFHWQSGYSTFSVSESQSNRVVQYIRNQIERHQTLPFQDELRRLLERHRVSYDERYVWD